MLSLIMLVVFHAAAGAIIGEHVNHGYWAFILGFISHFFLDFIPHGDRGHIKDFALGQRLKFLIATRTADVIITVILVILIFETKVFTHPTSVAWGIIGGTIPDFFVGLYELSRWKFLKPFYAFHHRIHNAYEKFSITFWHANFWQALIILGLLKLL